MSEAAPVPPALGRAGPPETSAASISAWPAARVFGVLLAFRIANALAVRTFFQPDEYFQSLEPAWQLAFGRESGAWITWEWKSELRSSLHPLLFAAVYRAASASASLFRLDTASRADLLIALPKACQALFAAALDYFTWRLAELIYRPNDRAAWASLALTVLSPWQWFCSTRTLSNSLETTLTAAALCFWPWERVQSGLQHTHHDQRSQSLHGESSDRSRRRSWSLRLSLLLAATASVLRPTNVLIWACVGLHATVNARAWGARVFLFREALICGFLILGVSSIADRVYYRAWTVPPARFLYFNLAQSLAVFYGRNRPDYYLTEAFPLLLTTALPFAVAGVWHALHDDKVSEASETENMLSGGEGTCGGVLRLFACTVIFVTLTMSLIAHKEVRFLYPLLPILHVLAAAPLASFFPRHPTPSRKVLLAALVTVNIAVAVYTTQFHQRGVIDVLHHLRHTQESRLTAANANPVPVPDSSNVAMGNSNMTVGFLMPCHSTPWRSHLVHPSIDAWALTCEPPLDVPLSERASYLDEADQFYADPVNWLRRHMRHHHPSTKTEDSNRREQSEQSSGNTNGERVWPDRLVFFEQLDLTAMIGGVDGVEYRECWRGFNTHWHDDWRRQGDVVVWCRTS
ncbi:hypothetical protein NA57DRAFT_36717 [Rhizodiscina lignyota]|uniref:Mannosyltransferase n=1 Tax=Rhizodiscina lignyota TaxID=1504668 RepID=A0A9P4IJP2_9PEZI|nr:hypothetical protein NA57DRAFT_36717 [Rhizodiscina lignyota]